MQDQLTTAFKNPLTNGGFGPHQLLKEKDMINFRIIKLNEPCELWSGVHEIWTKDRITAGAALMDGHRVEAFSGRQQRRISLKKAFYETTA